MLFFPHVVDTRVCHLEVGKNTVILLKLITYIMKKLYACCFTGFPLRMVAQNVETFVFMRKLAFKLSLRV